MDLLHREEQSGDFTSSWSFLPFPGTSEQEQKSPVFRAQFVAPAFLLQKGRQFVNSTNS
jgi:hypothetical protein